MKKNYPGILRPFFRGLRFNYPVGASHKFLNYSVAASALILSHPLRAQCPTVEGTLSCSQTTICKNTRPGDITLSGYSGNILEWQSADDALFTSNVTDIAFTSDILTSEQTGPVAATTYYRAVVQMEGCDTKYTSPIEIDVPLPVTYANGAWSDVPDETTPVTITEDMTLSSNLAVCSCLVTNAATVTIPSGKSLIVGNDLTVDSGANILVENKGSLLQVDDAALNTGSITFKCNTTTMKPYDYNYWSAPVEGETLAQLSPDTLFDKYYSFDPDANSWVVHPYGTDTMEAGTGYIIRAPQGWSQTNATLGVFEGIFTGKPINGEVPVAIQKGTGSFNLIGNPYPSAVNLDLFLTDPVNEGLINGTVYIWTHNTAISNSIPGNTIYNYTSDDYAKYNITGGVTTASTAISGGVRPTATLTSGQGFFIEANPDLTEGTYTAHFENYMRIDNNHDEVSRLSAGGPGTIEKHRLWVNISNSGGAYDEMLLGYITGATNDMDRAYDGKTFPSGNVVGIYSILAQNNLSIQGRALPFSQNDIIPLGYNTTLAGTFKISLGHFDGLFGNQNVYLLDKTTNSLNDLHDSDYSFTTEPGTFNDRFELRFTNGLLGNHSFDVAVPDAMASQIDKEILVQSVNGSITTVAVFDLTSRLLYRQNNINAATYRISGVHAPAQVVLVKILLENHLDVTRKVILD